MKSRFFITCFFFLSFAFSANAQCKVEIDEFKKDTTIRNKPERIGKIKEGFMDVANYLEAGIIAKGRNYFLVLIAEFNGIRTIYKGESIYLKFEDGSFIELKVPENSVGNYFKRGSVIIWYNTLILNLTESDLNAIASKKIKKVRCSNSDYEAKGECSEALIKQMKCINRKR